MNGHQLRCERKRNQVGEMMMRLTKVWACGNYQCHLFLSKKRFKKLMSLQKQWDRWNRKCTEPGQCDSF